MACNLAGGQRPLRPRSAHRPARRMGLGDRLRFRPEQLSGGKPTRRHRPCPRQRPAVILADEPTANLDSAIGRRSPASYANSPLRTAWRRHRQPRQPPPRDRRPRAVAGGRHLPCFGEMATDPVCGMTVARTTPHRNAHDGILVVLLGGLPEHEFVAAPQAFNAAVF